MGERFVGDGRLRLSGRNDRTLIGIEVVLRLAILVVPTGEFAVQISLDCFRQRVLVAGDTQGQLGTLYTTRPGRRTICGVSMVTQI